MAKRVTQPFPLSESQDAFALLRLADDGCPNHLHIETDGLAGISVLIVPTGVGNAIPSAETSEEAA